MIKKTSLFLPLLLFFFSCTGEKSDFASYVNPLVGTDYVGNTYPGAQYPFGMVQLSPDNGLPGWDRIAGYFYPDSTIAGFSHTHLQGTGAGDLYDISFMPVMKPWRVGEPPLGIYSKFSHKDEVVQSGYYKVRLSDYGIDVELTATPRVGIQRYTFPKGEAAVFLNLAKAMNWDFTRHSEIRVLDSVTVCGFRFSEGWATDQRVFFATRFSIPFDKVSLDTTAVFDRENSAYVGRGVVACFDFDAECGSLLVIKTALSGVSEEAALRNMGVEASHWNFDEYRKSAASQWNEMLSSVEVEGGAQDDKVNFYTALYHSFAAPTLFCDADSSYFGADKRIHTHAGFENYSTFSLWDTYRAAHPLYTLLQPRRVNDMVKSFLAHYDEFGRLPVWNFYGNETDMMIGYHSVPVIVDAYLKGLGDFDAGKALEACVSTANKDGYRGIGLYKALGYVPCDQEGESLSKTLEYAFDDWAIAQMAGLLGCDSVQKAFHKRALNYRNVFNPTTSFMQPRLTDGSFLTPFDAKDYSVHITESNAWQYLWSVQHDVEGLVSLLGEERFVEKLDSMFSFRPVDDDELPIFSTGMIGQYAHGNEPSHHVAYLYNAVRQPWKTQRLVAQIMDGLYQNSPAGLCGNEDCGQMSAWFVFSAMGFYPVNPVGGVYEIGTPLFDKIRVRLENGKTFTVQVKNRSHKNRYVQSVKMNGKPYHQSFLTHQQIVSGATVEFEMGENEGVCWY